MSNVEMKSIAQMEEMSIDSLGSYLMEVLKKENTALGPFAVIYASGKMIHNKKKGE